MRLISGKVSQITQITQIAIRQASVESMLSYGINLNLRNPMSAANQICEICGIRVICESPGSVATLIREDNSRMVICVICVICETFPEILLFNLRDCGICVRPF
jgi:hypothetical protein